MSPLVSILFPCYNAEKFLDYSLTSILNQDYQNLEIICINDGSTDNTLNILKSYQEKDKRIVILNNPKNLGLIDSLNSSFPHISGEYFARMDADDFSVPDRVSMQLAFMLQNSQYTVISSAYNYFRENGTKLEFVASVGTLPNALKFISLFSTPFAHGSVFGKTSLIKSGIYFYDKNFPHAEDFELFSRLSWQNTAMTNMQPSFYWARLNPESVSVVYNAVQIRTNHLIIKRNLRLYLGVEDDLDESVLKIMSNKMDAAITLKDLKTAHALFHKFYALAEKKLTLTQEEKSEIKDYLSLQTLNIVLQSNKIRFQLLKFRNLPFFTASLFFLKFRQLPLLFKKLARLVFHKL